MKLLSLLTVVLSLVPASLAQIYPQTNKTDIPIERATLRQTELDFAKAFADRNVGRFAGFVADDARFTSGGKLREGKATIVEQWTRMMQDPDLTLTWSPDIAEVSQAGDLGFTSGPYEVAVRRPDGSVAASADASPPCGAARRMARTRSSSTSAARKSRRRHPSLSRTRAVLPAARRGTSTRRSVPPPAC